MRISFLSTSLLFMSDSSHSGYVKLTDSTKAGGCAAKISSAELEEILRALPTLHSPRLLYGMDNFEDAAVYRITDDVAIIQTIDFFPPVVDDPYLFGRIAAVNALSDVYAMGGKPIIALNVLCFPTCDYPTEVVREILRGGADAVVEAGASMAGGHSIQASVPIYGLSVTGIVHPDRVLTNSGACEGDAIVISKPIGTGIALLGLKGQQLTASSQKQLLDNLTTLNNRSLEAALNYTVHAATDVTGFGLIGHLHEMAHASRLTATLWADCVPLLGQTAELAELGLVPAGAYANRHAYAEHIHYIDKNAEDDPLCDLLFDPQTAGGLLFALEPAAAQALVRQLKDIGLNAALIGQFKSGKAGLVEIALQCREVA